VNCGYPVMPSYPRMERRNCSNSSLGRSGSRVEVFSSGMRFFLSDWMRLPPRVLLIQLQIIKNTTIEGIIAKMVAASDARASPDHGMPPSERLVFSGYGSRRRILKQIPTLGFRLFSGRPLANGRPEDVPGGDEPQCTVARQDGALKRG
jgi:hypothetical protein